MKTKKVLALVLAIVMMAAMFGGCSTSAPTAPSAPSTPSQPTTPAKGDTINLGILAPLTGGVSVYGVAAANGAKMAIQEINAKGGIGGKQIKVNEQDEEGDATKAVNAYNKLVSDGVVAIIGDVTSKPTISVAQKSLKENMPIITPTGTAAEITTYGKNVFRACFLDPFQGETMATFAKETLKYTTVAVLYDSSDDYSIGCAEAFKATAEKQGLKMVAYEAFGAGDTDFKAQLTKIAAAKPEALFIPSYYNTIALVATQASDIGLKTTYLGSDGWDGVLGALAADKKTVVDGAYFTNHYFTGDQDPTVKNFVENYKKLYNTEANAFAALGYDAAMIMIKAIEKAGSTDAAAIITALNATDYAGVTGKIGYAGSGDPVKSAAIITIKDGAYALSAK